MDFLEDYSLDERWNRIAQVVAQNGQEVPGLEKMNSESWFDKACHAATNMKNKAYASTIQRIEELWRNIVLKRRADKHLHIRKKEADEGEGATRYSRTEEL